MDHMHHMDMDGTTPGMGGMTGMTGSPHMGHMGGMKMYFHMDYVGETVLFNGWKIRDVGTLILSMIAIFVLALLYEALRLGRQWLAEYATSAHVSRLSGNGSKGESVQRATAFVGKSPCTILHVAQALLHMVHAFLSYLLMMVFMTFNGWLCIALVLGAGAGYFAFGWRTKVVIEVSEHCH